MSSVKRHQDEQRRHLECDQLHAVDVKVVGIDVEVVYRRVVDLVVEAEEQDHGGQG